MKKSFKTYLVAILIVVLFDAKPLSAFSAVSGGELFGYVKDSANLQPVAFAVVVVKSGENVIAGANTDEKGMYRISNISPGKYTVEARFVNYRTVQLTGVVILAEQTLRLDLFMSDNMIDEVIVCQYIHPIINRQEISNIFYIEPDDIEHTPEVHSVVDIASTAPGIFQRDAGQSLNVRGTREDATQYIVDGVKMMGYFSVPAGAIDQMAVITGGIPAEYGDATGGVVVITTKSFLGH